MLWKLAGSLLALWLVLLTAQVRLGGWSHSLFAAVILIGVFEIMRGNRPAG
jgi:hypothetical protein